MQEIKFNSTGTDATYLANTNLFLTALFSLNTFKNRWCDDTLGSRDELQGCYEGYRHTYEGGLTGNRNDIAARKLARQLLDERIQKILYYVMAMGDQNDIMILLNSGVVFCKTRKKVRRSVKAVVAS
jgi:hypothetical protein